MKNWWLLLISFCCFSQNPPLKITIEAITSTDSITYKKFTVNYSIQNLTQTKIAFVLNPERIVANSNGSLNVALTSTLFQEKEELPIETILITNYQKMKNPLPDLKSFKNEIDRTNALLKYLKEKVGYDIDAELKKIKDDDTLYDPKTRSSKNIVNAIMTMLPNEIKHFSKSFYWDKNRYRKVNDLEFYISEKSNCSLELNMVLLKEEYKEKMLPVDYKNLMETPNLIKGWFTSNRAIIDFKE